MVTEAVRISIINRIELLGFNGPRQEMQALQKFVDYVEVIPLNDEIADAAIVIRKRKKMKLPDAVIAATALVYELTVVTRNVKDFVGIEDLSLINPHEV